MISLADLADRLIAALPRSLAWQRLAPGVVALRRGHGEYRVEFYTAPAELCFFGLEVRRCGVRSGQWSDWGPAGLERSLIVPGAPETPLSAPTAERAQALAQRRASRWNQTWENSAARLVEFYSRAVSL